MAADGTALRDRHRALIRSMASWCWWAESFFGRPKRTPRALARSRPSPVRARISVRSNSASAHDGEHKLAVWRRGVRPGVLEGPEAGARLLDGLELPPLGSGCCAPRLLVSSRDRLGAGIARRR
jgi:hypothetical protein